MHKRMNVKSFVALGFVALLVAGCGEKKKDENAPQEGAAKEQKSSVPYAEPALTLNDTVTVGGRTFRVRLSRTADESLPVVTDDLGGQFYDNNVAVVVEYDSGEMFFSRNFTKADFAKSMSEDELKGSVLLGMAFNSDATDGSALRFGAQVGQPGIEEGPAFVVEVPLNGGKHKIARDYKQDTTGEDAVPD